MPTRMFGLSENPFVEGHDGRFLYPCRAHREVVARLCDAIESGAPFALVSGPHGAGRTTAVQAALAEVEPRTLVRVQASASFDAERLRQCILEGSAPDVPAPASSERTAAGVEARLRALREGGRTTFLVVEEAQDLGLPLIPELLALADLEADGRCLLQVILVGRPGLEEALSRPRWDALGRRIALRCRLDALSAEETEGYVRHRLSVAGGDSESLFTKGSCQTLHRLTHGIPREINVLAGEALVLAHTAGETAVTAGNIAAAAVLLGFRSTLSGSRPAAEARQPAGAQQPVEVQHPAEARQTVEAHEVVDAEDEAAAPRPVEPASGTEPASPAGTKPASPAGAEVDAWLARFRDPSGPPRIGSRAVQETTASDGSRPSVADAPEGQRVLPALPHPAGFHGTRRLRQRSRRSGRALRAAVWASGSLLLVVMLGSALVNSSRSPEGSSASTRTTSAAVAGDAERSRTASAALARPELVAIPQAASPAHAPATTAPAPEPARLYGVEVATFIAEGRAQEERDRLAASIALPCRVTNAGEDGYAVVVGPVSGSQEATRLGADLTERGLVQQARVVRWVASGSTRR